MTVVAAVIRDQLGRILLAQRPKSSHMGGLWEFPGGKSVEGETPQQSLKRELAEELDIIAEIGDPLTFATHTEPQLHILLLFFKAAILEGTPRGAEGQSVMWVEPADLKNYPTPPADSALVRQLVNECKRSR
ncbi:MAG: (deoxy)nucleoside triphosphate pyrophosphohydrolase [bacterium]|nr:(deoxy)nucleoside triphosphate pyrophosphohydrolase [bacterium]